jgi:hypothetical protein
MKAFTVRDDNILSTELILLHCVLPKFINVGLDILPLL